MTTGVVARPHLDVLAEGKPVTQPLAYGYLRGPCDVPDQKVRRLEHALRALAALHGLHLVTFFFEFDLARSVLLQNRMLTRLEGEATAEVPVLRETA